MADQKMTQLDAATTLADDDLVYVVDDVAGTPGSKKLTGANLKASFSGAYASSAQGALADSAVQPGDDAATLGSGAAADGHVLTADGAGGAVFEAPAGGISATAGLTIVEITAGVWSADAPARDVGDNPILFVGLNDPADVTDGIATPANINARDRWIELASL